MLSNFDRWDTFQAQFVDAPLRIEKDVPDVGLWLAADSLHPACAWLKEHECAQFDYLNSICVVDYFAESAAKLPEGVPSDGLIVVYHLSSLKLRHRLVVKVQLDRWADAEKKNLPVLSSVSDLWPTANWHEREAYDLSGVYFEGHPNLQRILCPEDWVGHPLRKDYEMPLEYHGIRGR